MAFIDFSEAALPPVSHDPRAGTFAPSDLLTPLERRVVSLARTDGLHSLRPARKRGRLARLLLGPPPPSAMLANEQLEALRRLAVRAWHHGFTLPASALREARAAGYSEAQVGAVVDIVGQEREPFRSITA